MPLVKHHLNLADLLLPLDIGLLHPLLLLKGVDPALADRRSRQGVKETVILRLYARVDIYELFQVLEQQRLILLCTLLFQSLLDDQEHAYNCTLLLSLQQFLVNHQFFELN